MANKKTTDVNLKGVLNCLKEDSEDPQDNNVIVDAKVKPVDIKKKNRSFMLTDNTIKQLKELNFTLNKDLSTIVTEAVEEYYAAHQKDIKNTLK